MTTEPEPAESTPSAAEPGTRAADRKHRFRGAALFNTAAVLTTTAALAVAAEPKFPRFVGD
jgi:hypothetical protein